MQASLRSFIAWLSSYTQGIHWLASRKSQIHFLWETFSAFLSNKRSQLKGKKLRWTFRLHRTRLSHTHILSLLRLVSLSMVCQFKIYVLSEHVYGWCCILGLLIGHSREGSVEKTEFPDKNHFAVSRARDHGVDGTASEYCVLESALSSDTSDRLGSLIQPHSLRTWLSYIRISLPTTRDMASAVRFLSDQRLFYCVVSPTGSSFALPPLQRDLLICANSTSNTHKMWCKKAAGKTSESMAQMCSDSDRAVSNCLRRRLLRLT